MGGRGEREGRGGEERGGEREGDVEGPGKWSARGPRWLSAGLCRPNSGVICY